MKQSTLTNWCISILLLCSLTTLQAATIIFTGAIDDNWDNDLNWDLNRTPSLDDNVIIPSNQSVVFPDITTNITSIRIENEAELLVTGFISIIHGSDNGSGSIVGIHNEGIIINVGTLSLIADEIGIILKKGSRLSQDSTGLINIFKQRDHPGLGIIIEETAILENEGLIKFDAAETDIELADFLLINNGLLDNKISGTIILDLDEAEGNGFDNQSAGVIINAGHIKVINNFFCTGMTEGVNRNQGRVVNNGFMLMTCLKNEATLINQDSMLVDFLLINSDSINNQSVLNMEQLVNNNFIANEGTVAVDAIFENRAKFDNVGLLSIGKMLNHSNAVSNNTGMIQFTTIEAQDTGMVNRGSFFNLIGGEIQNHRDSNLLIGIFNDGKFSNAGECRIGKVDQPATTALVNRDSFINKSSGFLRINNISENGIDNKAGAILQNIGGNIIVGEDVPIGKFGIVNEGVFQNMQIVGKIDLVQTNDDALVNQAGGHFVNEGRLEIGVSGSIGRSGIFNTSSTFINESDARIRIENAGAVINLQLSGLTNADNSNFTNKGNIEIFDLQNNYSALQNISNATFLNDFCGLLKSDLIVENNSILTNNGFIESSFPSDLGHINTGTFTNNAIIEDPFGSFSGLEPFGNDIVNNGLIIEPIFAEDDQTDIEVPFTIGAVNGNYQFGDGFGDDVFDANNQLIGEFDLFDNIVLNNPLPIGNHELKFNLTDLDHDCVAEISLFVEIEEAFNCTLTSMNATNGASNGTITTLITGGDLPFTFAWELSSDPLFEDSTQNLTDLTPGHYFLTISDASDRTTKCNAAIGMVSEAPDCGATTIFWDGGLMHDQNNVVIVDTFGQPIFGGDGMSWGDPVNWRGDVLPGAGDVVGGIVDFQLNAFPDRHDINLNIDATVKGYAGEKLSIPLDKTLTVNCGFSGEFENSGTLIVTAGTAQLSNIDFVNNGRIDVTGVGALGNILSIRGTNSNVNNGIIKVNNLARGNGRLLHILPPFFIFGGEPLENNGLIDIENGVIGILGELINKTDGFISITNVDRGIASTLDNEGDITIVGVEMGLIEGGLNKMGGMINIDEADIGIILAQNDTLDNSGTIILGSPGGQSDGNIKTGIFNHGTFFNNDTLIIKAFTEAGLVNQIDDAQLPQNTVPAEFVNDAMAHMEVNGKIDDRGRPIPEYGIINENSRLDNDGGDLFIKDIRRTGVKNLADRDGGTDVAGDGFVNSGVLTLNFIGVNVNNPKAIGIHNFEQGIFQNSGEILIGTFKGDFTNGGKVKGVGMYLETNNELGVGSDSSLFHNEGLIKIDNIISGGVLDDIPTGHGILSLQVRPRHIADRPNFVNTSLAELRIGGHKPVSGVGIRVDNSTIGQRQVFHNEGKISINQTGRHGVHVGGLNIPALFQNDGDLDIGDQNTIEGDGIFLDNGFFKNTDEITINAMIGNGINVRGKLYSNSTIFQSEFINEGDIKIGNMAGINSSGIAMSLAEDGDDRTSALFVNEEIGTLTIDRFDESGIEMTTRLDVDDGTLRFENNNSILIGSLTTANALTGANGIDMVGGTFTEFGVNGSVPILDIDGVDKHGIKVNGGIASLRGVTSIGVNSAENLAGDGIHLEDESGRVFASDVLTINNVDEHGIFISDGELSISFDANVTIDIFGDDGIHLTGDEAELNNSGDLTIFNRVGENTGISIHDQAGILNNKSIQIISNGPLGLDNGGNFFNTLATSELTIMGADTGILNRRSLFNLNLDSKIIINDFESGIINLSRVDNKGLIEVTNPLPMGDDLCLDNRATIDNRGCAEVRFFGTFENSSTIRNFGFFKLMAVDQPTQILSGGLFENNGVIEDVQMRLAGASIVNNDVLLQPTCFGDPVSGVIDEVVQLGGAVDFTIGTVWTDAGGVFGNGTYDQVQNEASFVNPLPNGPLVVDFVITDDFFGCVEQVQQGLDFTATINGVPTNAGPDQLVLCDTMTMLAANSPPLSAAGAWSFTDAGDGQGVIEDATDPNTGFTGSPGQSYTLRWTLTATCGSGTDEVIISFDVDQDGDGFLACAECNDDNPAVFPGAPELCDGLDNDCNGLIDDTDCTDIDGDGFTVAQGDCDDNDNTVFPGAPELCDGKDNDCNGNTELVANTWTGGGDALMWTDRNNWSDGIVPVTCQDVVIPAGHIISVPVGVEATCKTLEIGAGAEIIVDTAGEMSVGN